jgi:23S rRNA pseudouridine1911/1915/1917 synthase
MLRMSKSSCKVKTDSKLIDYLMNLGYTRTKIKQLFKYRAIQINDERVKKLDQLLIQGDRVSISKDNKESIINPPVGIKIIYEDDAVIVTEKPPGLLTIASETEKTKTAYYQLNEFLKHRVSGAGERIFIVHRLDRDTSGLIVFAKNEGVKRILQDNWNEVEKRYYAIVEGAPVKKQGEIMSHLREAKSLRVYSDRQSDKAKSAITKFRVLKQRQDYALLDILLVTGRKNQIRVHLADIGHPVAGDKKYGAQTDPLKRLGLHAYLLSFKHPITGNPMCFKSEMPERFRNIMLK